MPAISATQIQGNARIPYLYRVIVTDQAIVRQRKGPAGGWQTVSRNPLTKSKRAQFQTAAAAIDLSAMRGDNLACHGVPIGDVAQRLLNLLAPYLS
jgi:hypothetical protein